MCAQNLHKKPSPLFTDTFDWFWLLHFCLKEQLDIVVFLICFQIIFLNQRESNVIMSLQSCLITVSLLFIWDTSCSCWIFTFWPHSMWIIKKLMFSRSTPNITYGLMLWLWRYGLVISYCQKGISFPARSVIHTPAVELFWSHTSVIHNRVLFSCHVSCPYFLFIWATHHEFSC